MPAGSSLPNMNLPNNSGSVSLGQNTTEDQQHHQHQHQHQEQVVYAEPFFSEEEQQQQPERERAYTDAEGLGSSTISYDEFDGSGAKQQHSQEKKTKQRKKNKRNRVSARRERRNEEGSATKEEAAIVEQITVDINSEGFSFLGAYGSPPQPVEGTKSCMTHAPPLSFHCSQIVACNFGQQLPMSLSTAILMACSTTLTAMSRPTMRYVTLAMTKRLHLRVFMPTMSPLTIQSRR